MQQRLMVERLLAGPPWGRVQNLSSAEGLFEEWLKSMRQQKAAARIVAKSRHVARGMQALKVGYALIVKRSSTIQDKDMLPPIFDSGRRGDRGPM